MKYKLNKEQQKAVEYTDGPLLIVAGAGTGKTTVVTSKIAYLIEKNLTKPENILALTFTDKAAYEMIERVDELINIGYAEMQISTFHAFCQKLLEQYALDIGLPNQFKLLTQTDAWLLVRQNLDKFNLDYYKPLGNPTRHIHELLKHFSKCKDEIISAGEYLDYAKNLKLDKGDVNAGEKNRLEEIASAYHIYNQLLLDNNSLDFGDLIFYVLQLLEKRPHILKQIQDRFKYILVDEFQDVNFSQYKLIQKLTGKENQLTVVGDDDQSIYAFRGANVQNILRFKKDYKNAKEIVLNENYRSGQKILDVAYKSIQNNNPHRLEVELNINKRLVSQEQKKTKKFQPEAGQPLAEKSNTKEKGKVIHSHLNTLDEEVDFVIEEIKKIKNTVKDVLWDDFAILIRANAQAVPFLEALGKAGVPNEFLAASGLYRQPIVLDAFNFLKVINDYHESGAIYRLLRMPFLEFSENDMQALAYNRKKKSVGFYTALKQSSTLRMSNKGIKTAEKIINIIHEGMKQTRHLKPTEILVHFFEKSGYNEYLIREEESGDREVLRQIYQLRQFFDYIKKFEEINPGATVNDFLEHFDYLIESGEQGALHQAIDTPDSVNIITTHKSKGMEYRYVFVVNLVEGRFPSRRKGGDIELPSALLKEKLVEEDVHFEEERRLFYVAITRAKERLYLVSADNYGGVRKKKVSRFLNELGYEAGLSGIVLEKSPAFNEALEDKKVEKSGYQIPKVFSISQIKTYLNCPYQYKLQYILNIPQKGKGVFSYGSSMHNTLQKFYQKIQQLNNIKQIGLFEPPEKKVDNNFKVKVPRLDELLELFEQNWIDEWYESKKQKEDYFKKGKKTLKEFYKKHENNWTVPVALETGFKVRIGDYLLAGRIDRIDRIEGENLPNGRQAIPNGRQAIPNGRQALEIIDYKTGKGKEKLTADDKDQLLLYQIAAENLVQYKNLGVVEKLTYYYLDESLLETSFLGKEKELEKFEEKIIKVIEEIKAGKFEACSGGFNCKFCEFKDIC